MNLTTPSLMTDLVLNCLWQAGCLTVVTLVAVLATHRLQIAMRKLILNLVLLSWLILPVWNLVAVPMDLNFRQLSIAGEVEPVVAPTGPLIQPEILAVEHTMVAETLIPETGLKTTSMETSFPTSALNVFGLAWLVGILVGIAKLLIDHFALSRLLRKMEPVTGERVLGLWNEFLKDKVNGRAPALFLSDVVDTPFSTGCFRARVVLPIHAVENWSDEEILAAMSHEFAHWQQRDLISCRLQRFAQTIYWWNPAITFLNRQLNHLQEVICDTIAVDSISSQRNYAQLLIKIAENFKGVRRVPSGTVGMARNISSLEQRIQTITRKETNMKSIEMKRRNVILACSTACCLALPLLGVQLTHGDEHRDDDRDEHREIREDVRREHDERRERVERSERRERRSAETGIAEIVIKENGVTRMIRIPLNEEVRHAKIQDIIKRLDDREHEHHIDWTPKRERRSDSEHRVSDVHEIQELHFATKDSDDVFVIKGSPGGERRRKITADVTVGGDFDPNVIVEHILRPTKEDRKLIGKEGSEIRELHFETKDGDNVFVIEGGPEGEHLRKVTADVRMRKESGNKIKYEDSGSKARIAHVKPRKSPHKEMDILVIRKDHEGGDPKRELHFETTDKHGTAIRREGKDVSLFIPKEVESELRKDLRQSQDQIRQSEQQVRIVMKEKMAKIQDEHLRREMKMEDTLREQQQQLEKMIAAMEKRMEALSRENEAIRKELENARNSLDE